MTKPQKKKILIIDDEPDIIEVLSFELAEFELITASNGLEAIEQVQKHKPDLVLSDVSMPKMDGLKMIETLRAQNITVPIVFVTAFTDEQDLQKAKSLGAFDLIDKPINFDRLQTVVKSALKI